MSKNHRTKRPLGVHTLTEFEYCPRAGLISHYQEKEDEGHDGVVENLNYMPLYELAALQRKFERTARTCRRLVAGAILVALLVMAAQWASNPLAHGLLTATGGVLLAVLGYQLCRRLWLTARLAWTIRGYAKASSQRPDLNSAEEELLDWRRLIRGFDLQRTEALFFDQDLGLGGSPWKLLRRGNLCIPVFRCRQPKAKSQFRNAASKHLYRQHYVRIGAYCELIERTTGDLAPFGVILFSGTFTAVAIKPSGGSLPQVKKATGEALEILQHYEATREADFPHASQCRRCPHGYPANYEPGADPVLGKNGPVAPLNHEVRWGKVHSVCGDLFRWTPPHEKSIAIGLFEDEEEYDY